MAENKEISTELISPSPDVVLVVGTPPKINLMVSSATLSNSSVVFAAMLGPKFREGQDISTAHPKEVTLPDDEPETMSDICYLLHGKSVQKFLTATETAQVLDFAVAVDKYGCVDALRMQSHAVLLANLEFYPDNELLTNGQRMVAAYLLQDSRAFYLSTKNLLVGTTKPYHTLLEKEWSCHIPTLVLYALEVRRSTAQRELVFSPTSGTAPYDHNSNHYGKCVYQLRDGLGTASWPPKLEDHNIASFTSRLRQMPTIGSPDGTMMYAGDLRLLADKVETMCGGICMACIRERKADILSKYTDAAHAYP